ncbi:MAG: hypothetical protein U0414_01515 [Polyangiaceae bacterium]
MTIGSRSNSAAQRDFARALAGVALLATFALTTSACFLFGKKSPACTDFQGGKLSATWSGCPDGVKREVKCEMFVGSLKCDCYEDGVNKWFFQAKDPPLEDRADATRVANANCHWGLE